MSTSGKVRVETASEIEKPSPLSEKPNNYTTAPAKLSSQLPIQTNFHSIMPSCEKWQLGSSQSIGKNKRPACFLRCNVMTILTVSCVFALVTFLSAEGSPCEEKNERREAPAPMCQTIFLESNGHLPGTWGSREEKPPGLKNKPDHIVPTNLGSGLRELRKVLHGYDSAALQRLGRPCRASKMPVTT